MKTKEQKLKFQCCFCGETVKKTTTDPVEIGIFLPDGTNQGLWAHGKCIQKNLKLHPSVPLIVFEEGEGSNEGGQYLS